LGTSFLLIAKCQYEDQNSAWAIEQNSAYTAIETVKGLGGPGSTLRLLVLSESTLYGGSKLGSTTSQIQAVDFLWRPKVEWLGSK
jgi:hypothetical protein